MAPGPSRRSASTNAVAIRTTRFVPSRGRSGRSPSPQILNSTSPPSRHASGGRSPAPRRAHTAAGSASSASLSKSPTVHIHVNSGWNPSSRRLPTRRCRLIFAGASRCIIFHCGAGILPASLPQRTATYRHPDRMQPRRRERFLRMHRRRDRTAHRDLPAAPVSLPHGPNALRFFRSPAPRGGERPAALSPGLR